MINITIGLLKPTWNKFISFNYIVLEPFHLNILIKCHISREFLGFLKIFRRKAMIS